MLKRVPHYREKAMTWVPEALVETVNEVKTLITEAAKAGKIDPLLEARRLAETDQAEESIKKQLPPNVIEKIRTPWPSLEWVKLIFGMTWRFVSTDGPSFFLTSDNPAFFFTAFGLGSPQAELTFPISSHLALHGCWNTNVRDHCNDQQLVKEFNRRLAVFATRFVFYRSHAKWIRSVVKRRDQSELNRIQW